MKLLYTPANSLEANLLKDILQQEGIDSQIHGEYLHGGIGELPPLGIVQLLVEEEDLERAGRVIAAWEAGEYAI